MTTDHLGTQTGPTSASDEPIVASDAGDTANAPASPLRNVSELTNSHELRALRKQATLIRQCLDSSDDNDDDDDDDDRDDGKHVAESAHEEDGPHSAREAATAESTAIADPKAARFRQIRAPSLSSNGEQTVNETQKRDTASAADQYLQLLRSMSNAYVSEDIAVVENHKVRLHVNRIRDERKQLPVSPPQKLVPETLAQNAGKGEVPQQRMEKQSTVGSKLAADITAGTSYIHDAGGRRSTEETTSSLTGNRIAQPPVADVVEGHHDVVYRRVCVDGPVQDLFEQDDIGDLLLAAVELRNQFMTESLQPCFMTVHELIRNRKLQRKSTVGVKPGRRRKKSSAAATASIPVAKMSPRDVARVTFRTNKGVIEVFQEDGDDNSLFSYLDVDQYLTHLTFVLSLISNGPLKSFCFKRLKFMTQKFQMHAMMNLSAELAEQKANTKSDFYSVPKVDTHIHLSACMNHTHLLTFMKHSARQDADRVVIERNGKELTMAEVFESIHVDPSELTLDSLDVHAGNETFHRFDRFNLKYNPIGESRLREIFLKPTNFVDGEYFGKLVKEVIERIEASDNNQYAELRISVYGRSKDEFSRIARWFVRNNLASKNIRWMIQVPRLFYVYKAKGMLETFEEMIENIFLPIFEVTRDPASDPDLVQFLEHVVAFDSVDDESKPELVPHTRSATPDTWTRAENPPYSAYLYYMHANIAVINKFRAAAQLNTFSLRPHAGEAGPIEHMVSAFLLADSIAHGIELRKAPVLQYLYYLTQIGMSVSPMSNNKLFLGFHKIPFKEFHEIGLNVTLSTDDPLQFHMTRDPLIEEYSVAAQVWKLSQVDLAEIARNSALISSFPEAAKAEWFGANHTAVRFPATSNIAETNVPSVRATFRLESLAEEVDVLLNTTTTTR